MSDENMLNGTVNAGTILVGTSATLLPASIFPNRKTWLMYNDGSVSIFLGGSTVTSTTGIPVGTGTLSPRIDLANAKIYGITAAGNATARILEIS